jgi:putative tryptophan/tyrosine transport system substrate-binding protein
MGERMKRREFITLLGGAAVWPLGAQAQQPQRMRRIGVLLPAAADDAEFQDRIGAFLQGLQELGWSIGRNVRIETRWATTNAVEIRRHAAELAALAPDAILAASSPALAALQQATRTVPIVFVNVIDPVGSGFVDSLTRPSGNTTGFLLFECSLSGKWLELLKLNRAKRDGSLSRYRQSFRERSVRRHPDLGAIARDRGEPDQHARRQRDRARRGGGDSCSASTAA